MNSGPSENPSEDLPQAESPKGYDEYLGRGGTLTAAEFTKVWETSGSSKLRHVAEEAGIYGDFQQIMGTSILGALKGDVRLDSTLWLRNEAYALMPKKE